MVLSVVDNAELAGCHAVNLVFTVNGIRAVAIVCYGRLVAVGGVTNLEGNVF